MKKINLTKNAVALIDDDDYEMVNQFTWYLTSNGYAATHYNGVVILMHRLIMLPGHRAVVDHLNHNKTDNRKSNLRICTQQVNTFNHKSLSKFNRSGRRGISWDKVNRKWRATIKLNQKQIHLGRFYKVSDAIKAREKAEKRLLYVNSHN